MVAPWLVTFGFLEDAFTQLTNHDKAGNHRGSSVVTSQIRIKKNWKVAVPLYILHEVENRRHECPSMVLREFLSFIYSLGRRMKVSYARKV